MTFAKSKASKPSLQGSARTRGPTGPLGGGRSAFSMQLNGALALRATATRCPRKTISPQFFQGVKEKERKKAFSTVAPLLPPGLAPREQELLRGRGRDAEVGGLGAGGRCCSAEPDRGRSWRSGQPRERARRTGTARRVPQPGGDPDRCASSGPAATEYRQDSLWAGASWRSSRIIALEQMSGCLLSKSNALFLANLEIQFG